MYDVTPGLPRGHSSKESTCQCRRHKRHGFDPWVGKIPWSRKWQPAPVFWPENPMDRGAWRATVHGAATSWTWLSVHTRTHPHTPDVTIIHLFSLKTNLLHSVLSTLVPTIPHKLTVPKSLLTHMLLRNGHFSLVEWPTIPAGWGLVAQTGGLLDKLGQSVSQFLFFSSFKEQLTKVITLPSLNNILVLSSGTPLSLGSPSLSGHFRVNSCWFRASAWSLNLGTSQGSPSLVLILPHSQVFQYTYALMMCRFLPPAQTSHLNVRLLFQWIPWHLPLEVLKLSQT